MIQHSLDVTHKDLVNILAFGFVVGYQEQTGCNDIPMECITRAYSVYKPHIDELATVNEFVKTVWTITNRINLERISPNVVKDTKAASAQACYQVENDNAQTCYTRSEINEIGATGNA